MAAWFGGTRESAKDVEIWYSVTEKGTWRKPVSIANGIVNDTLRYPCWNPVLFTSREKKLFLFYKVGPSPRLWWGMVITSIDEGKTWSSPIRLPAEILGPIKNKPVLLTDGTILSGSSLETELKWSAHMEISKDGGANWKKIQLDTSGFDIIQPTILHYGKGKLQALFRSKQGVVVQSWSSDNGQNWSKLLKTELLNPNSGIDAVTLKNGEQLLIYNPELPGKTWNNGRAKLHVAISKDGIKWVDIMRLESGTTEEYSYPAVIEAKDGKVHITYTYDRKNIKHVVIQRN